jgi:hypothetical protein
MARATPQTIATQSDGTETAHRVPAAEVLGDLRFRALLAPEDWEALPLAIRRRFSERLAGGRTVTYSGIIVELRTSRMGWLLAHAARLVGGPLPTSRDVRVPATVAVTEDEATGGQFWTRVYGRHKGFPQVIHSSKRFSGPTGLVEYLGYGMSMALTVDVGDAALHFRSAGFFTELFGLRLALPSRLNPFKLTVSHFDLGDGRFAFQLDLHHSRLGELIHQRAIFADVPVLA